METRRSRYFAPLCIGLAWVLAGACAPTETPRRIVLITVDTLRVDAFEGERASLPHTADFARRGLVFGHAYSASSSTQPTHATLFTGLHPWQSGVPRNGAILGAERETLAEILHRDGWETVASIGSFPLHRKFGWSQGFDEFDDSFEEASSNNSWNDVDLVDGFHNMAEVVADRALKQLDAAKGNQQFFWFHFYDPHAPYGDSTPHPLELALLSRAAEAQSPELPGLLERARFLYDRDTSHLDRELSRVLERLARDAAEIETHIVFTADHGESFGEDGSLGHGKRLTPSQVHVPLFIVSPRVSAGRVEEAVGSVDLFPTLLGLAGSKVPAGTSGRDLLGEGSADVAFGMRRTFVEPFRERRTDGTVVMVSAPRFYRARGSDVAIGDAEELYVDFVTDEGEAADLKRLFAAFERELLGGDVQELLDDDTQKALEALGYTR